MVAHRTEKVGRLDIQSTVTKMRRLARAYQARLNFYLINRGDLPDYEGVAAGGSAENGRGVVVGAVSALRPKQPYDFTFDPHSELSVEKLKDWIDLFLSGKLKKVGSAHLCKAALVHPDQITDRCHTAFLHRPDRRSRSCRIATLCRSRTRRGPCISTISPSGIKLWATSTSPCSRSVHARQDLTRSRRKPCG